MSRGKRRRPPPRHRRPAPLRGYAATGLLVGAAVAGLMGTSPPTGPGPVADTGSMPTARAAGPATGHGATQLSSHPARLADVVASLIPPPVRLRVPAAGIDGHVVPAGLSRRTGQLSLPADASTVAWFENGSSPGEAGSAVLAGHVTFGGRRGVFARLSSVPVGARVQVAYADGTRRVFRVLGRRAVARVALPAREVFSRAGAPVVTLITCGGRYDAATRSYARNVLVFAVPAAGLRS